MSDLIPFAQSAGLPAHLADVFGEEGNIGVRVSTNQLSFKGKIWRIVLAGEETKLTKPDADSGDEVPVQIINVVVLDHNKKRSRTFFEGGYEEGKATAPTCYSNDGDKPDASVKEPQCATCAACPQSVKGSKITENNKQTTACSPVKRVAIVPRGKVKGGFPPLLLKLAQTSIWDKTNPEEAKGWYAWDQYLDMLRARGAKHTAMVETRIKFDASTAYPKLLFSASGWLNADEVVAAKGIIDTEAEAINAIINGSAAEDGVSAGAPISKAAPAAAGADDDDDTAAAAAAQAKASDAKKAKAKAEAAAAEAAAKAEADAATEKAKKKAARVAAAEAAAEAARQAALAAAEDDDDDDGATDVVAKEVPAPAKPPKTAPKAKAAEPAVVEVEDAQGNVVSATPSSLSGLLAAWDDE